jgi:serine/threonine-protein kinase RsbW
MRAHLDESFPATIKGLHAALEAIETFSSAWKLQSGLVSRVRIIVEELFTNTIKYGYGGECDRPVRLHLTIDSIVRLTFEDDAPQFDPTCWQPDGHSGELHQRPEGQAGIPLIMSLSSDVQYMARSGGNRLVISIRS